MAQLTCAATQCSALVSRLLYIKLLTSGGAEAGTENSLKLHLYNGSQTLYISNKQQADASVLLATFQHVDIQQQAHFSFQALEKGFPCTI